VERVLLVVALAVVVVAVALLIERRRRPPAPTNVRHTLPEQLDRRDFERPEAPWLVAVFTSATCHTCSGVWDKARLLASVGSESRNGCTPKSLSSGSRSFRSARERKTRQRRPSSR